MIDPWVLLGLFIFISYTIEAMTGFGSIVIAVSLGALVLPLPEMLPVLVPLNILMSGYLSVKHRQNIHWPTLTRLILPSMVIGTLIGHFLKPYLGNDLLKSGFGLLILWFATRELWRLRGKDLAPQTPRPALVTRGWMTAAGVTHGLFASGGPLLVYALSGNALPKDQLRATLISVWFALNSLLTLVYLFNGSLVPSLPRLAYYIPVIALGVIVGERLHHRINELQFRRALFTVLAVVGFLLALPKVISPTEPSVEESQDAAVSQHPLPTTSPTPAALVTHT